MSQSLLVALAQLNSKPDIKDNLAAIQPLVAEAAAAGAKLISLPENALMMRRGRAAIEAGALAADAPELQQLAAMAKANRIWLHLGSVAMRMGEKLVNRCCVFDEDGRLVAGYDKIHLFDVDLPNGEQYRESDNFAAGKQAVLAASPWGGLGLSICYDLRFPQLYRLLAQAGAGIIFVPAAFTAVTGAAHWHVLLRARAIETGCFIVAAAQDGWHEGNRQTYGHSLVVNPWGEIIAERPSGSGILLASLELDKIAAARAAIPAWRQNAAIMPPQPLES